jgi:type IV secretory pathway VirB10-like protein
MKRSISRLNRLGAPTCLGAKALRATFAAMICAAVVVGCTGHAAWAADDADEEPLADQKIVRHILQGLGLRRPDQDKGIEYRERSPLVLPGSSKELPKPTPSTPAAKTAGWPDDPDIKRQKQRREAEKNRKAYVEGVDDRPMLQSDYEKKKGAEDKNRPTILDSKTWEEANKPSTNQELGSKNIFSGFGKMWGEKQNEYVTFTGEPRRETLIEPPRGYRTPSPNQPFGVGPEKWKGPGDRQEQPK